MYACDFEYDGKYLSDFGYILGRAGSDGGVSSDAKGSEISFITASTHDGKRFGNVGSKFENCLKATFHICKNPAIFGDDLMEITRDEFRDMNRWLNRREFLRFRAINPDEGEFPQPFFYASFNLAKDDVDGKTFSIELNMQTNAPFGYDAEKWETFQIGTNGVRTFHDMSDEPGNTYPQMLITCKAAGTLRLRNSMTGCDTVIENCADGEVISFSGDSMIISSSVASHDIANDFNYNFFSIGNTYASRENVITSTLACRIELGYEPIRKDAI